MEFIIERKILLKDVEEHFYRLRNWEKSEAPIDLVLPTELDNNYFGLVAALIQLGITWTRSINSRFLYINPPSTNGIDDWNKLYDNELIFPLVSLVWNSHEIRRIGTEENLRSQLQPIQNKMFARMRSIETLNERLRGHKLLLTQLDHFSNSKGILPCFERDGKFLLDWKELKKNLHKGLERVLAYSHETKQNFEPIHEDTVIILYELMKNTWEWARENSDGVALDPNIRGMLVRYFTKKRETLLNDFYGHEGLTEYFSSKTLKENSEGNIYFLEISVFDSGIGLVDRYRESLPESKSFSPVQVVKECLTKHNTTADGLGKKDKGRGLDRILATLDRKGFLRIRTGEVCVYRNMISDPYQFIEKGNADRIQLFDWAKESNTEFECHVRTEGSVITIIYPLSTSHHE